MLVTDASLPNMDSKGFLLAVTLLAIIFYHQVEAEFYYNYVYPKAPNELKARGLKCVPGRTTIQIKDRTPEPPKTPSSSTEDDRRAYTLRTHMNSGRKEEYCKICICSIEGKDEFCSGRPAVNVNECLRLTLILKDFKANNAYEHTRSLPLRIRRDYIYHNDEIPYEPKSKCRRGHAYYTNNKNANDTDIDVSSDIESLLDYGNTDVCLYCVCAVDGREVDCMKRDLWFCHYLRYLRTKDAPRDMYARLFQQDRPTYFRQFSWRLRRTMDDGIYDFVETVGNPDKNQKCIPFVSEYTDCNDENSCSGCNKCVCIGKGEWSCEVVKECTGAARYNVLDEDSIDGALEHIERGLEDEMRREKVNPKSPLVPAPHDKNEDPLIGFDDFYPGQDNVDVQILRALNRKRRSSETESKTTKNNIKFYHTVDEINEDILKNDNRSGTIQAAKFENLPKASRRVGFSDNDSLVVELTEPKAYESHINENKIDVTGHSEDKYLNQENDRINILIANHTVKQKDKELSKLIVNELKNGSELIGDKNAPIMSNITFTSENDTLTAMAFIAGNLLNQLWDMEKDSNEDSRDTEDIKHEKIADLLDLFKEPLNIRQESFLKNALQQLSVAIDKDKFLKNVSLCDKIDESRRLIEEEMESPENFTTETLPIIQKNTETTQAKEKTTQQKYDASAKAISKIADVLNLMEKFQNIHKTLNNLKQTEKGNLKPKNKSKTKSTLTNDETVSVNIFGKILEKITKLLMPDKKSKKVVKAIKNQHLYAKSNDITRTLKDRYGIDIGNTTLTAKDKMLLDYLNTVKSHPNCIFHNIQEQSNPFPSIEGDILLNLSEFFKIKSFMDLIKLLNPEKEPIHSGTVGTKQPNTITTLMTTTSEATTITTQSTKLSQTKERLKDHIKSIIEDLRELQTAKGFPVSNISIADTLPCIYKILKGGEDIQDKLHENKEISPIAKISSIFNSLKRDLLAVSATRRNNVISGRRPKSAVVWERVVKNFDGKRKAMTRRMDSKKPKSFDEIKKIIKDIEMPSNTYKNQIIIKGVKPANRLALLKTLNEETKKYIEILESIKQSTRIFKKIPTDIQNDLNDFVYNAAMNINLNNRVMKKSNSFEVDRNIKGDVEIITPIEQKTRIEHSFKPQPIRAIDVAPTKKSLKLTRDQIINQLIKNRMEVYISIKEAKKQDLSNDFNYDIAKKILRYLEMGNHNLARELYKFIINQKEQTRDISREYTTEFSTTKNFYGFQKEPLMQFEEPTTLSKWRMNNRDSWLKQLVNLKKM